MKENLETKIITEKIQDTPTGHVYAYPYPNIADCIRAMLHIARIAGSTKRTRGAVLIIKP